MAKKQSIQPKAKRRPRNDVKAAAESAAIAMRRKQMSEGFRRAAQDPAFIAEMIAVAEWGMVPLGSLRSIRGRADAHIIRWS